MITLRRSDAVTTRTEIRPEDIRRFWAKVQKGPGCWTWTASTRDKGYGAFVWTGTDGKIHQDRAHRFSYLLHVGPIPQGACVLHSCDNPGCARPEHLHLGSKADNNAEMRERGRARKGGSKTPVHLCRYRRGINHPLHKLTEKGVRRMRKLWGSGLSVHRIARDFGINVASVRKVLLGRTWTHVK